MALGFLLGDAAGAGLVVAQRAARGVSRTSGSASPPLAAAYLAGAGINAVIPAHAGDVTKVFLVKRQIPDSSYPAVTSSFFVQSVFDTAGGPARPSLRDQPGAAAAACPNSRTCRPSRSPSGPTIRRRWRSPTGALMLAIVGRDLLLAHHVRRFWARVRQGLVILTQPRDYLREVVAWQGVGWLCRFAAFWFFLEAFGLDGSIGNVMLVMSVQAISTIIPLTPGGAGAQQALLVATLAGPSRAAVLSFSVGTQIAMAAWSVVLGFAAMLLVFRTTDWRGLIRQAQEEAGREEAGAQPHASTAGTR